MQWPNAFEPYIFNFWIFCRTQRGKRGNENNTFVCLLLNHVWKDYVGDRTVVDVPIVEMDGLDITISGEQKKVTKKAERFIEQLWIGSLNVGIKIDCNYRLILTAEAD